MYSTVYLYRSKYAVRYCTSNEWLSNVQDGRDACRFVKTCCLMDDPFEIFKEASARGSKGAWLQEERDLFKKALAQVSSGGNPKNFVLVAEHFRGRRVCSLA